MLRETFTWVEPETHKGEDFLKAAEIEEVYVAVEAGDILGLAAFYRPGDFIHSLYVDARGRGIGKALIDHLETVSDGPLSLKVQRPNWRAQAFYAREGFVVIEEGQDPPPGAAWLRMRRCRAPW